MRRRAATAHFGSASLFAGAKQGAPAIGEKSASQVKRRARGLVRASRMKAETQSFYDLAVRSAVAQVLERLDEALDLQALARAAALSPFHFHRVFRGMVGETPLELHRRLRLERAAWSLVHTDLPVTTIAFAAGYETHESFTRAFRTHYACAPSEFRQRTIDHSGPSCADPTRIELACRSGIHFQHQRSETPHLFQIQGGPTMNVEIKDLPELRVATLAHVGPYNRISEAFAKLGEIAGPAGLFGPGTAMIGIYHDDPETTPPAELRSEAALSLRPGAKVPEGLGERRIPAGRYASTTHVGPYQGLGDTWSRLMGQWLPASGQRVRDGVSYEIYRNTPQDVPPDQLKTELYVPIA
jgi:AraC family transcriptional regulator